MLGSVTFGGSYLGGTGVLQPPPEPLEPVGVVIDLAVSFTPTSAVSVSSDTTVGVEVSADTTVALTVSEG